MYVYKKCPVFRAVEIESFVTFTNEILHKNHYFPGESHDFWEVVFVLAGKLGACAGKDVFVLEGGDVIIHRPNEFHSLWSEQGTAPEIVILSFYASRMPSVDGSVFKMQKSMPDQLRHMYSESRTIFSYANGTTELVSVLSGKERQATFFVQDTEGLLCRVLNQQNKERAQHPSLSAKSYMHVLSVLEEHIHQKLSTADIARMCNMSESSIKKVFHKYAGCGVMHYCNSMKIRKAAECIENGMSIKEAADLFGFTDQNYFSTVFKRIIGVSPAKYK